MSSSNNREQSSPSSLCEQPPPLYSSVVRYFGLEPIYDFQLMGTAANWADLESDRQRSTAIKTVQLANQLSYNSCRLMVILIEHLHRRLTSRFQDIQIVLEMIHQLKTN